MENPDERLTYKDSFYFRIKDVDVINLKSLYTMLHEYFVEGEYCGDEEDFPETYLRERKNGKGEKDVLVVWHLHKQPGGISFYQWWVDILIKVVALKDAEVMQGGKKFKVQKGAVEIKVWSGLEYDAEKKWRENWFLKHILHQYVYRINKKVMEKERNDVMNATREIQSVMKEFLSLVKYSDKKPDMKSVGGNVDHYG